MNVIPGINKITTEKTCIVGMGNTFRRDDGVGPYIADGIISRMNKNGLCVYNVEDVFENYVFKIAGLDCKNILLIDGVKNGRACGDILFGKLEEFSEIPHGYSTHKIPLYISGNILRKPGMNIYLLGISVRDTNFGRGLSKEVKQSADLIKDILIRAIEKQKEHVYEH